MMAMGTNIGLTKMADATPGISYENKRYTIYPNLLFFQFFSSYLHIDNLASLIFKETLFFFYP